MIEKEYYRLNDFIRDDFPLAILPSESHKDQKLHSHDFQELVMVFSGTCLHVTESSNYRIGSGDVFVVSGDQRHGYRESAGEGLSLTNILFDLPRLKLPLQELRTLPGFVALFEVEPKIRNKHEFKSRLWLPPSELLAAEKLVLRMAKELKMRNPGYKSSCLGLFLELLTNLSRIQPERTTMAHKELFGISRTLSHLNNHYAEKQSLPALAKMGGMSKRNFQNIFKNSVGESPIRHLLNIRLDRAAEALLTSPSEQVGELALKTGFHDSNYFSRQFMRRFKMSPTEYRKAFHVRR